MLQRTLSAYVSAWNAACPLPSTRNGAPSSAGSKSWSDATLSVHKRFVGAPINAVLKDGDAALVTAALGDIARAKGMSKIATDAGLGRESLYRALSQNGNPEFATVLSVIRALGLRLLATPAKKTAVRKRLSA